MVSPHRPITSPVPRNLAASAYRPKPRTEPSAAPSSRTSASVSVWPRHASLPYPANSHTPHKTFLSHGPHPAWRRPNRDHGSPANWFAEKDSLALLSMSLRPGCKSPWRGVPAPGAREVRFPAGGSPSPHALAVPVSPWRDARTFSDYPKRQRQTHRRNKGRQPMPYIFRPGPTRRCATVAMPSGRSSFPPAKKSEKSMNAVMHVRQERQCRAAFVRARLQPQLSARSVASLLTSMR